MKKAVMLIVLLLAVVLPACTQDHPRPAYTVGADPVKPQILEQDTFNIAFWLESGVKHRALVRLSSIDGLAAVNEDAFTAIDNAVQARDYKALLSMGDNSAPGSLYTYDNAVYLSHRLGIADEVYWVVPIFGTITQEDLDGFKEYLKKNMPGQAKDIAAITLKDKVAEGEVNGVPIKIMGLQDLPKIEKPVVLDVDMTYLTSLYRDEKNTRLLGFVSGFFKTLKERGLRAEFTTLCPSNINRLTPLRFRFLARWLSELFAKPAMIDGQPPELWAERADAWRAEQKSPKQALPIYRNIIKKFPQDAASHYDLSAVYFELGNIEGCKKELAEAIRLDPEYMPAYEEYASRLGRKGNKKGAEAFLALDIDPKEPG